MKRVLALFALVLCTAALVFTQSENLDPAKQWPWYRGYLGSGVHDDADLPLNWDLETGENVVWTTEVAGLGLSSPVIWGDMLFITTAVSEEDDEGFKPGIYGSVGSVEDESEHEWIVYCYDKHNGELIWERTACRGVPEQKRHPKSSHANSTVATDGKFVVAFFGSEGLYCYDMKGALQWSKDFGVLKSNFFVMPGAEWEFASSPIMYDGLVIVQCDVMDDSFVAAYEVETGEEAWKQPRDEYPGWCTPNIYRDGDRICVALNGYKHRGGYDFETGEEIWKMDGGGDIPIPMPVVDGGLIFFNSAHGKYSPVLAIRTNASGSFSLSKRGTVDSEYVQWMKPRGGSYMQTMLVYEGLLYNAGWNGTVDCFDAQTGEEIWRHKAGSGNSYVSSPVAADGKIYLVDDQGGVYTIRAGREYELLAENDLQEISMATPAISDGLIFFRTTSRLIAVGTK